MLLTQNSNLKRDGIWNWTLPAWVVELPDGGHVNVCPSAGACAKFCYARNGTYLFPNVRAKHMANLLLVRDDPRWVDAMCEELSARRFRPTGTPRVVPGLGDTSHLPDEVQEWLAQGGKAVRVHDAGDYFDAAYLNGWFTVARAFPDVLFYSYTKRVAMLRAWGHTAPSNFLWLLSMGARRTPSSTGTRSGTRTCSRRWRRWRLPGT
jgi:hypothetical protein